jgi:hypothetical protein
VRNAALLRTLQKDLNVISPSFYDAAATQHFSQILHAPPVHTEVRISFSRCRTDGDDSFAGT